MYRNKKVKKLTEHDLGKMHKNQLDQAKAKFGLLEFTAENSDGSVRVIATGKRLLKSIEFRADLLNREKNDIQEAIVSVVNDALIKVMEANILLTSEVNEALMSQVQHLKKSGRM